MTNNNPNKASSQRSASTRRRTRSSLASPKASPSPKVSPESKKPRSEDGDVPYPQPTKPTAVRRVATSNHTSTKGKSKEALAGVPADAAELRETLLQLKAEEAEAQRVNALATDVEDGRAFITHRIKHFMRILVKSQFMRICASTGSRTS